MTPAPPPVSPLAQPPSSSGILRSLRRLLRPSSASSTLAKPGSPLVPVSEDDAHLPSMAKPAAKLLKPRAALPLSPPSSPSSPVHAPAPLLPLTGTSTARTSKAASSDSLVATHFETESIVEAGRIAEARSRAVPTISVNAPSPQSSFAMEESAIHDIRFTRGVPLRLHRPGTGSVTLVHLGVSPMTHMLTGIIAFESDALGSPPFTPDVRTVFCVHYGFDDVHSYPLVGSPLTPLDMLKPHTYLIPQATSTSAKICGSAKFAFPYQSVFIRDLYSALRAAGANTSLSNFLIDGLLSLFVDIYLVPTPKAAPSDTPITLAQIQLLTPIMSARFDAEFMAEKNPDVFDHSLLHVPGDG
ncbi:hypothetical protein BC831DRAFT_463947 [Entophlyctis helioformis]|nr:hypothetical protein BC831DRAFT_463947 [Entophlyctis helioformis]